jgi:hypothetical protein
MTHSMSHIRAQAYVTEIVLDLMFMSVVSSPYDPLINGLLYLIETGNTEIARRKEFEEKLDYICQQFEQYLYY